MAEDQDPKPKRIARRSFLIGATTGAVATGAGAAGLIALRNTSRKLITPSAVESGKSAEIAESFQDSHPAYTAEVAAPADAPNVVVIVLDDIGFADLGCFGSEIRTPSLDALAGSGLRYANFRTCAMCSPTRAALMTGLNHHSAGMGWLADIDSGYPGYRGDMTLEAATLAEVLRDAGWTTLHVGKWHVNLAATNGANGPYHNWPTNRGFDRAYWFQGHSTDYFRPAELVDGIAPVQPPPDDDYFVSDALTDRAIALVRTQKAIAPDKPFYLQLCYPSAHSPLQVRPRDRDSYLGVYDAGWDAIRAARLARQRSLGLVPETTKLPPLSPGADPWDTLDATQKRVYARYMELYAGQISNLDANVGRLLTSLEQGGWRDNTLVVVFSDNGASAEGTPTGTPNVLASAIGHPVPLDGAAKLYDVMGTDPTFPHYPVGWACTSNTPFRLYKQYAHLGGVADPLIISWPKRIAAHGQIRQRFVHVIDLYPTILEAAGAKRPEIYRGRKLKPLEGASIAATFGDANVATRTSQYFELGGQRSYMDGDWRLATRHERGTPFEEDKWELYDVSKDPNELNDLAAQFPDKVKELLAKWNADAEQFGVFPLDDRNFVVKMAQDRQRHGLRAHWEFLPPIDGISQHVAPFVFGFSHEIQVELSRPRGANGVLVAHGSKHGGYALWIDDGRLVYEANQLPWAESFQSSEPLPEGPITVRYVQTMTSRPFEGGGALYLGDRKLAEYTFNRVLLVTSYDGFSVGSDLGNQVSQRYHDTNPFQGTIARLRINVDTTPYTPFETKRFIDGLGIKV